MNSQDHSHTSQDHIFLVMKVHNSGGLGEQSSLLLGEEGLKAAWMM